MYFCISVYVDFQNHEALAVELDRLHLEHTWCNAVFADELESWQVNKQEQPGACTACTCQSAVIFGKCCHSGR